MPSAAQTAILKCQLILPIIEHITSKKDFGYLIVGVQLQPNSTGQNFKFLPHKNNNSTVPNAPPPLSPTDLPIFFLISFFISTLQYLPPTYPTNIFLFNYSPLVSSRLSFIKSNMARFLAFAVLFLAVVAVIGEAQSPSASPQVAPITASPSKAPSAPVEESPAPSSSGIVTSPTPVSSSAEAPTVASEGPTSDGPTSSVSDGPVASEPVSDNPVESVSDAPSPGPSSDHPADASGAASSFNSIAVVSAMLAVLAAATF